MAYEVTSFDELSFEDISATELNENFDEIAMDYLTEIEELKDNVTVCRQRLREDKLQKLELKADNEKLKDIVRNLKSELRQKNEDISRLKDQVRNASHGKSGQIQPRVPHLDPAEISFKTKMLIRKIHEQHGEYLKTGTHENIDQNIAEVRGLFNMVLNLLNELNLKNKAVTRTLESLTKLDVK